jgi:predicted DCC family thiol-disulfide oxidoreductase YuxK
MKRIAKFLKNSFDKSIDGTGLAVFRMAYSFVLLCEITQMFYFKELIFDKIPFIDKAEINFGIPIAIWFFSVFLLLFGLFTRFATIINYLLGLILIGSITTFEYHVFYAYMGINFLLLFMPVSRCLSLDRLLLKLKYSNTTFQYNPPKTVSQLNYLIVPLLGLAFVYFDSVFYKLASSMWMSGLGSWMPSSLPMITHANTSPLLNSEYLIKSIGWLTILFEFAFLFLFFRKKWRIPLLSIGLILHLGILLQFPIPWFALTGVVIYILMVPVSFWKRVLSSKKKVHNFNFYYDTECPLCIRTKIIISHLDWFNKIGFKTVQFDAQDQEKLKLIDKEVLLDDIHSVNTKGEVYKGVDTYLQVFKRIFYLYPLYLIIRIPGIYHLAAKVYTYVAENRDTERCTEDNCGYNPPNIPNNGEVKLLNNLTVNGLKRKVMVLFITIVSFLQLGLLYQSWSIEYLRESTSFKGSTVDNIISKFINSYSVVTRTTIGITPHPVFADIIHFDNYNHIIGVVYLDKDDNEIWLPIIDENGQPSYYIYGANWVNWTFRVDSPNIETIELYSGIKRYTAFWAHKNNIDLNDATFLIKVKKIDDVTKWEKDFLNKQIDKPWISGGEVIWKDEKYFSKIKDIESL